MRLGRAHRDGPVDLDRQTRARYHAQRNRLAGLRAAFSAAGVAWDRIPVVERFDNSIAAGASAAAELLGLDPGLTAIITTSDVLAFGVLQELERRHQRVPQDVAVTGFDGVNDAIARGLTTVHQPFVEKGRRAGRLLLEKNPRTGRPPDRAADGVPARIDHRGPADLTGCGEWTGGERCDDDDAMLLAAGLPALGTMLVIAATALVLGLGALWLSRRHTRREQRRLPLPPTTTRTPPVPDPPSGRPENPHGRRAAPARSPATAPDRPPLPSTPLPVAAPAASRRLDPLPDGGEHRQQVGDRTRDRPPARRRRSRRRRP